MDNWSLPFISINMSRNKLGKYIQYGKDKILYSYYLPQLQSCYLLFKMLFTKVSHILNI